MERNYVTVSNLSDGEGSRQLVLPKGTPFGNWKEARRYAGPLPFTFTYNQKSKKILIIEGVRQNWKPKPIKIIEYRFSFLDAMNFEGIILANAFIINNIPYFWKKGKSEHVAIHK